MSATGPMSCAASASSANSPAPNSPKRTSSEWGCTMSDQAVSSPSPRVPAVPGVAVALAGLSLFFAVASPGFLSAGNLSNVLVQSVILLLLALPMTLIIMTEGLDLSMGAVLTLASLVLALIVVSTQSLVLALLG